MKSMCQNALSRRTFLRYGAAGAAALVTPTLLRAADDEAPLAKTTAGQIRGQLNGGVFSFKGVPYGMDTAKTRFAAPKPAEPWEGVRDCLTWGPRTIQPVPNWPYFDLQTRPTMIFDDEVRIENDPRKPQRLVIQQIPYVPNQT